MAAKYGYIGNSPDNSSVRIARRTYTLTGVQTNFTFDAGYDIGYVDVYLNGVKQIENDDFIASDGTTVGFTSAPLSGDIVEIVAYKAFDVVRDRSVVDGDLRVYGNVNVGGAVTATSATISGSITGTSANISGAVTATSFVGSGAGITGVTTAITAQGLTGTPNITVGVITATTINTTAISAGSTTGTSGQLLQSTGTGVTWAAAPAGGVSTLDSNLIGYNSAGIRSDSANGRLEVFGTGNFRVFTSPGTFTVNPGISSIRVRVVGAGGNGGNGGTGLVGNQPNNIQVIASAGGGGGGGGGYAHKVITSPSFPAPRAYTVTVGSAPGGTSSFGAVVSATGGSNGTAGQNGLYIPTPYPGPNYTSPAAAGGAGGAGSGGDVNFTGATGTSGATVFHPGAGNFSTGSNGGPGGASATQKGNGSGSSVPGLPSASVAPTWTSGSPVNIITGRIVDNSSINRFPFDIFNGTPGVSPESPANISLASPNYVFADFMSGFNGGNGTIGAWTPSPFIPTGIRVPSGNGGTGAGGGGGAAASSPGISGGPGGNGGIGGGGAGGSGAQGNNLSGASGGSGGTGGNGIVIVEW